MFIENQQFIEYYAIVVRNKLRSADLSVTQIKSQLGYTEKHHIIPTCLGGSNTKDNVVYLPAADHFKCHQLLIAMTTGTAHGKMWSAIWRMMNKQSKNQQRDYVFTADDYNLARQNHAITHSARMSGSNNPFFNKKHSVRSLEKMSAKRKGKSYEEIYGAAHAAELRLKRSQEQIGRVKGPQKVVQCAHCAVIGGISIMNRWHGDKCKQYSTDTEVV